MNKKLPIYKQVPILSALFAELGIKMVYNNRTRETFISLLAAPTFVEGEVGQMTLLCVYDTFSFVMDNYEYISKRYKHEYAVYYASNPAMLEYLNR